MFYMVSLCADSSSILHKFNQNPISFMQFRVFQHDFKKEALWMSCLWSSR